MRCEQAREALSARLDGEDELGSGAGVDTHLDGCQACRQWFDDAAAMTRLLRTSVVARPTIDDRDLVGTVIAAAPGTRWARGGMALRAALAVVGFGQFVLGVAQVAALGMGPSGSAVGGMTADHLWHESAAWNIAIGAGYAWIAVRRSRPAGALPMLTAFVGVLLLLSIEDLATGEVAASALLTHGFVALGYVILLALRHPGFAAVTPPARRSWRLRVDDFAGAEARIERVAGPGQPSAGGATVQADPSVAA
jgi:predicted anti-sigma-YlaC factor YlaD